MKFSRNLFFYFSKNKFFSKTSTKQPLKPFLKVPCIQTLFVPFLSWRLSPKVYWQSKILEHSTQPWQTCALTYASTQRGGVIHFVTSGVSWRIVRGLNKNKNKPRPSVPPQSQSIVLCDLCEFINRGDVLFTSPSSHRIGHWACGPWLKRRRGSSWGHGFNYNVK